jgi:hypothetical protein
VEVGSYEAAVGTQLSSTVLAADVIQVALSNKHGAALTADGKLCGLALGEKMVPGNTHALGLTIRE